MSMSMPSAITHRCSAKYTPSIINATRSSPDRSEASRSTSACSVSLTNLRESADLLVDFAAASVRSPTGSSPSR